jgi:hypothetical protein
MKIHLTILALAGLLTGCAATRQVAFTEADFTRALAHGTGVVAGRAYVIDRDHSRLYASRQYVDITPVNAYTTENIQRRFIHGEKLRSAPAAIDKYDRTTTADAEGNFVLRGIPPGDYYLRFEVPWTSSYPGVDDGGNNVTWHVNHSKLAYARISVKNGQTVRVTTFDQRNPQHDGIFAYSGNLF